MRHHRSGFTLIEVLIVVVIMAVLAATIIPQFTASTSDAKQSALDFNTHSLRAQIELYKIDHNGLLPTLDETNKTLPELLKQTNAAGADGTDFGPYLVGEFPANPFSNNDVVAGTGAACVGAGAAGWQYDVDTGGLWPNNTEYWP